MLAFVGCKKAEEQRPLNFFTVNFDTQGGHEIAPQKVQEGQYLSVPDLPEKDGYSFVAWKLGDTQYNFGIPVTSSITLTAQWSRNPYFTVHFDTDGGNEVKAVEVDESDFLTAPTPPQKEQAVFDGWYVDGKPFDFSAAIQKDITLKARWINKLNLHAEVLSAPNTFWWGKGGNYYDTFDAMKCFDQLTIDHLLTISNLNFKDMMTIVGFGLSNYDASTVDESKYPSNQLAIQYTAYPAKVAAGEQYLVMYKAPKSFGPTWNTDSLSFTHEVQLKSIAITNNAYAYLSMLKGDAMGKKFGPDDWFKVTIEGYNAKGEKVGEVEAALAEHGHIVDDWKAVDLSALGKVKKLTFNLASSDPAARPPGDFNTPFYICLKDILYY
ncbi:hypothetical protein PEPS_27530 (plasmid) [Persicobacter psychrovividus]|uniref:Repeat protein n=2 Tax=Persicobacter psychrovividus TaxID=387638 RepID=A0ABM7VHN3_9BACT|nr:hypothetical protein PEPS_27530 [Persicobacter psychrovividus]